LFWYALIGFFSSAAVVGDAGGGTLASVVTALAVAAVVSLVVAATAVSLFVVLAGEQPATARARNAKMMFFKRASFVGMGANPTTQA
jgi:hypothetical protein